MSDRADKDYAIERLRYHYGALKTYTDRLETEIGALKEASYEFDAELTKCDYERRLFRAALQAVVSDVLRYEVINNLAPNPGRKFCWDSVAIAVELLQQKKNHGEAAWKDTQI